VAKSDGWKAFLPRKIRRENRVWYSIYCTLLETFSSFQVRDPIFPNTYFPALGTNQYVSSTSRPLVGIVAGAACFDFLS
jgi:hypothetical protein